MYNTEFISNSLNVKFSKETQRYQGYCNICGRQDYLNHKINDVVSSNFTDFDISAFPNSDYVCDYCKECITNVQIRRSGFIAYENEIVFLKRESYQDLIFNIKNKPFIIAFTKSFKKHLSYKSILNYNTHNYIITGENNNIRISIEEHKILYDNLLKLYSYPLSEQGKSTPKTFFTKEEILTGNYNFSKIEKYGKNDLFEIDRIIKRFRNNLILDLFIYILNAVNSGRDYIIRTKEEKKECQQQLQKKDKKSLQQSLFNC